MAPRRDLEQRKLSSGPREVGTMNTKLMAWGWVLTVISRNSGMEKIGLWTISLGLDEAVTCSTSDHRTSRDPETDGGSMAKDFSKAGLAA